MKDDAAQGLTCWDVMDRAFEYLEDHLAILTKVQVSLHFASCAHCRTYVEQINLVSSAMRSLPKLYPLPANRLYLRRQFAARHGQPAFGH